MSFSPTPATTSPTTISTMARDYRRLLAELTFNSKPIINALTLVAQENAASDEAAAAIARTIESKLREVRMTVWCRDDCGVVPVVVDEWSGVVDG